MADIERHISVAPHDVAFFHPGEFVYNPDAAWDQLHVGTVFEHQGTWQLHFPTHPDPGQRAQPLVAYQGRLARHVLIDCSGFAAPRGPAIDSTPWQRIDHAKDLLLRNTDGRRLSIKHAIEALKAMPDLDAALIEDSLRMSISMGFSKVVKHKNVPHIELSDTRRKAYDRRDYLASLSEELLAKSRRIDTLLRHSGTVGSYREELVRALLRQVVPTRYEVSTGFIAESPRQLDVLVWDAAHYSPLFHEQNFVVVPAQAVRAILEVKTRLTPGTLVEAIDILEDVTRRRPQPLPIFKGIFAFESDYKSDKAIIKATSAYYNSKDASGCLDRKHTYLFQGIDAICVPNAHYVRQEFMIDDDDEADDPYPAPFLFSHVPDTRGDMRTGFFLGELLSYLDLSVEAKRSVIDTFSTVFLETRAAIKKSIYMPGWRPTVFCHGTRHANNATLASRYIERVNLFRMGKIATEDIGKTLPLAPEDGPDRPHPTTSLD